MSILPDSRPTFKTQSRTDAGGKPIILHIDGARRTAGFAMPNGYWYRRIDGSRNFLRRPPGIASGKPALAEAERLGCMAAKVVDSETGDTYLAGFDVIRRYGVTIQRTGWEPQIALPFDHWRIIRRDGTEVTPIHERQAEPATNEDQQEGQLSLFEGAA